ncbi:MAG: HEAT repeat domain-containing protein [Myxococcota bacterium]
MRRVQLAAAAALVPLMCGGTCLGEVKPEPSAWDRPGGAAQDPAPLARPAPSVVDGGMDDGGMTTDAGPADPFPDEAALRTAVKPPSLCFSDPSACGLASPAMSLSALRPTEETLDRVEAALKVHPEWPLPSRMLHCETLAAFRPLAGVSCVGALADDGGILEVARRTQLLMLLEILGRHGNGLTVKWLRHQDVNVRRDVAAWVATRAVDDTLVDPLLEALDHEPDARAGVSLIRAFSTLLTPKALPLLSAIVNGSSQPEARAEAVRVIADILGPQARDFLRRVPRQEGVVGQAVVEALDRLDHLEQGWDPYVFEVPLHVMVQRPDVVAGGWAFMEDFKRRRGGPMPVATGARLTREELDLLLRRLVDAGGFGLTVALPTLAINARLEDLQHLMDLRRAIAAARLREHDAMSEDVTRVMQVVRTHFVLGRATRWWYANQVSEGDPLRFNP